MEDEIDKENILERKNNNIPFGICRITLKNGWFINEVFYSKKEMDEFINWTENGTEIKRINKGKGFIKVDPKEIYSVEQKQITEKRAKYLLPIEFVAAQKSFFNGNAVATILKGTILFVFFSLLAMLIKADALTSIEKLSNSIKLNNIFAFMSSMITLFSFAAVIMVIVSGVFRAIFNPKILTNKKEDYYSYVFNFKESKTRIANDLAQIFLLIGLNYLLFKPLVSFIANII